MQIVCLTKFRQTYISNTINRFMKNKNIFENSFEHIRCFYGKKWWGYFKCLSQIKIYIATSEERNWMEHTLMRIAYFPFACILCHKWQKMLMQKTGIHIESFIQTDQGLFISMFLIDLAYSYGTCFFREYNKSALTM